CISIWRAVAWYGRSKETLRMSPQRKTQSNRACHNCLKSHPIFGKLRPNDLKHLHGLAGRQSVAAGKTIFANGNASSAMFAICAGAVKIVIPSVGGVEIKVKLLFAGDTFGDLALLGVQPRITTAVAVEDCELMVIKRSDFQTFLLGKPSL